MQPAQHYPERADCCANPTRCNMKRCIPVVLPFHLPALFGMMLCSLVIASCGNPRTLSSSVQREAMQANQAPTSISAAGSTPKLPVDATPSIATITPTPTTSPTAASTPEPTDTPTPSATPTTYPARMNPTTTATPMPSTFTRISADNAAQLVEIGRWGAGRIAGASFSPTGQYLAVATALGLDLYNAATWEQIWHTDLGLTAYGILFTPDGQIVVATGKTGSLFVEAATGQVLYHAPAKDGATYPRGAIGAQFFMRASCRTADPNNPNLCIRGYIEGWDWHTGQKSIELDPQIEGMPGLALSADEHTLAAGYRDVVKLFDFPSGREVQTLECPDYIYSLVFSPDGKTLAAGCGRTVRLWNLAFPQGPIDLPHVYPLSQAAFTRDGHSIIVLTQGSQPNLFLWDLATAQEIRRMDVDKSSWGLAVRPIIAERGDRDGFVFATLSSDDVTVWNTNREVPVHSIAVDGNISTVTLSPDGRKLAIAPYKETSPIVIREVPSGQAVSRLPSSHWVTAMRFLPDNVTLALGYEKQVELWDIKVNRQIAVYDVPFRRAAVRVYVSDLAPAPNGRWLALAGGDQVIVMDVATGQKVRTLECDSCRRSSWYWSVDVSPNGQLIAGAGTEILTWNAPNGQIQELYADYGNQGGGLQPHRIRFSSTGRYLSTTGEKGEKQILLWDLMTGREMPALVGHGYAISTWAFSPDDRLLASISLDQTVRLWDVVAAKQIWQSRLSGSGLSVIISPDGHFLIFPDNGVIRIWAIPSQ